ncbi:PTS sugar transporter subunit IIA [Aurantiacibacter aquimixticola]|uniref:PTS sugar transporter subunit IIA n=1 Tax=Aurantiacibacter aquimixticola TaxID=1958945 RepID=A0A419RUV6_9SPHN|nr:PTS sugar transporter subunit IIA [Aurantiacibacter aquimixticola]RJY09565.1 PTS sugar transporter subunit IIA [Aurantiacibacter aquimixticola]
MNSIYALKPEAVAISRAAFKEAILDDISDLFAESYDLDRVAVRDGLQEREKLGSTGFGRGVAIPHARVMGIHRPVVAMLKLDKPVDFEAADGLPVDLVVGLLSPENCGAAHLHALAAVSRLVRDERMHEALIDAPDGEALFALLTNVTDRDAA